MSERERERERERESESKGERIILYICRPISIQCLGLYYRI